MNAPVVDLPALHDTLGCATLAAFIAEDGDAGCTSQALSEAAEAAAFAFPPGSPGADALKVLFDVIGEAAGRRP